MTDHILPDWGAPPKTVPQVARWLGIDVHKIYDAINKGELPTRMPNGNVRGLRLYKEDVVAWLKSGE